MSEAMPVTDTRLYMEPSLLVKEIDRLRAALAETVAGLEPFAVIGRTALWLRAEATKPPADIQPASLVDCEHAAELVARYKEK